MYNVRDRTPTVLYLQTVVLLHVLVTHWAVTDSEWVMGTRPPHRYAIFWPVKITAMFGKLLQPEAIFDSSCIKSYGDQARSES